MSSHEFPELSGQPTAGIPEGYHLPSEGEFEDDLLMMEMFREALDGGKIEFNAEHQKVLLKDKEQRVVGDFMLQEYKALVERIENREELKFQVEGLVEFLEHAEAEFPPEDIELLTADAREA